MLTLIIYISILINISAGVLSGFCVERNLYLESKADAELKMRDQDRSERRRQLRFFKREYLSDLPTSRRNRRFRRLLADNYPNRAKRAS